jgi:tetratricopeptide (TPR) repeat protein
MLNQVLWTIDNELDGGSFERLCIDLLYRNGYKDIVPIEPQDGGRDAQEFPRQGRGRAGEAAFFQFSGVPAGPDHLSAIVRFKKPTDERLSESWAALEAGAYEHAAVALKDYLDEQPESVPAWQALAWPQYCVYRYDEALASINRALKLQQDPQGLSIRASILAEKGIKERSKTPVLEAQHLGCHYPLPRGSEARNPRPNDMEESSQCLSPRR